MIVQKTTGVDMFVADFHIHSKYSLATSRDCVPEMLNVWARRKGLRLIGTGDFTHPAWRAELMEKLVPAEEGFIRSGKTCGFRTKPQAASPPPVSSSPAKSAPFTGMTAGCARCTT